MAGYDFQQQAGSTAWRSWPGQNGAGCVSAAAGRQADVIWTDRDAMKFCNFFFFSLLPLPPLPTRASSTLELLIDTLSGRSRIE